MALAEIDGWDDYAEVTRAALAHIKAALHNELLPLLARAGYQVKGSDYKTPESYLRKGGRRRKGQTNEELDAELRSVSGLG